MAKNAKTTNEAEPAKAKQSIKSFLIIAVACLLLGVAGGFGVSFLTFSPADAEEDEKKQSDVSTPRADDPEITDDAPAKTTKTDQDHKTKSETGDIDEDQVGKDKATVHGEAGEASGEEATDQDGKNEHAGPAAVSLDPVVTNILAPSDVWVRLEAVLKTTHPLTREISDQIHQDFMAFFHTLRLEDLEGGSSFNDLKAELVARANGRANGSVENVYFKTFLFE